MTPSDPTLAPCPFCGGGAVYGPKLFDVHDEWVQCQTCLATVQTEGAVSAWNYRAPANAADREALARIIDPEIWLDYEHTLAANTGYAYSAQERLNASLAKADQIIALRPSALVGEIVEECVTPGGGRAVHYEQQDVLEYVSRDVPSIARNPVHPGCDILLDMETREPIGWRIYGWSKRSPAPEPLPTDGVILATLSSRPTVGEDLQTLKLYGPAVERAIQRYATEGFVRKADGRLTPGRVTIEPEDMPSVLYAIFRTIKRQESLRRPTDEAMRHLGCVLWFFAELDPGDRCKAFDDALDFYNLHNPNERVEPIPGFTQYLTFDTPLSPKPKTTLKVIGARIVRSVHGPDNVMLEVTAPNPAFPFQAPTFLNIAAAADTGADYVRDNFGIEPEII